MQKLKLDSSMQTVSTTTRSLNLLIVHNHQMIREGLKMMLKSNETTFKFNIVEAESGEAALGKAQSIDVAIVDYELPGMKGSQAIIQLRAKNPYARFLALFYHNQPSYVREMSTCGAVGYVSTHTNAMQLVYAIKCAVENKPYHSTELSLRPVGNDTESCSEVGKIGLTKRELEILSMIAEEKTNEDMAEILFISKRTVDTHRQNLLHKLRAKNTAGLIKAAYQLKIV